MAPGVNSGGGTGGSGAGGVASPAHTSQGHRGVQRSISATSNKPRRGSTGPPAAIPRASNNHTTSSNFKRQNTVDSATIKENTARLSQHSSGTTPQRSSTAAQQKATDNGTRAPTSPTTRGITKSNTMSNATGRQVVGGSASNRRSAIGCEQKSSSSEKTNALGTDPMNTSVKMPVSPTASNRSGQAAFQRQIPARSTFHSGQTRRPTPSAYGVPLSSQDTSALNAAARNSFFSKLSSKFSKRADYENNFRAMDGTVPPTTPVGKPNLRTIDGMAPQYTPAGKSTVSNVVNESGEIKPRSLRFTWSMKTTSSR